MRGPNASQKRASLIYHFGKGGERERENESEREIESERERETRNRGRAPIELLDVISGRGVRGEGLSAGPKWSPKLVSQFVIFGK